MRMFVAVDIDDDIKSALPSVLPNVKQTPKDSVHLTLAFLGDVPSPQNDRIIAAMREPIESVRPFRLAFRGLGIFPPRGAPRVLWLGVSEGERDVIALQRLVARRLETLGVALEDRAFHPHLTIGRWKQSRPSDRPLLPADVPATPGMTVDHVTLYESRLSSEGPAHFERARARLGTLTPS